MRASYLTRDAEMTVAWVVQAPFTEAAWQCDGNPANVVFVLYFETALPAVRVEYGDAIAVMIQSAAASGARYDGVPGRFFWEKGGSALFAWEQGAEQGCVLVAG